MEAAVAYLVYIHTYLYWASHLLHALTSASRLSPGPARICMVVEGGAWRCESVPLAACHAQHRDVALVLSWQHMRSVILVSNESLAHWLVLEQIPEGFLK